MSGCRHLGPSSADERRGDARSAATQWHLLRRAKPQTCRRLAGGHEPPQRDEELASQRDDHRLAFAAAGIRRSPPKPLLAASVRYFLPVRQRMRQLLLWARLLRLL